MPEMTRHKDIVAETFNPGANYTIALSLYLGFMFFFKPKWVLKIAVQERRRRRI